MPMLGKTLVSIGQQLPDIYRTNKRLGEESDDRLRKQRREDVRWGREGTLWNQEQGYRQEGDEALQSYENALAAQTPLPPDQAGPVAPERSRFELGMSSGLPKYKESSPKVKGLWNAIEEEEKLKTKKTSGLSVFEKKMAEAKRIDNLPEGPEKEQAKDTFLMGTATGTAYGLSDEGISQAGKKAATVEYAKIPPKMELKEAETNVVDQFEDSTKLRKEFNNLSKTYKDVRDSYNRVLASAKDPSAAGDLALIFNYMKILDPGSVVRESEFATAAASGSFGDRLQAAAQKVIRGERLSVEMRRDFENRANLLFNEQLETHKGLRDRYADLSTKRGLAAEDVIGKPEREKAVSGWTDEKESRYQELMNKKQSGTIGK